MVVAPVRCLLQPIVGGLGDLEPVRLRAGDTCDPDELLTRLVEIGYAREDLVGRRGDVAVRGGIIDVFSPTDEHPVRIEFFGDTVEEIRYFKVADQRSLGEAPAGLWAPPCRELLLTAAVRDRAKQLAAEFPGLSEVLGKLADGIAVEGMEAFAPVLAERMDLLTDYVPAGGLLIACDPERIRTRAEELVSTSREFLDASWVNAAAGGEAPIDLGAAAFQPIAKIREAARARSLPWWTIEPFGAGLDEEEPIGADGRPRVHDGGHRGRELPRCHRRHDRRHAWLAGRRLARCSYYRRSRAGAAAHRGAPGRGAGSPDGRAGRPARAVRALRRHRGAGARVHLAGGQAGRADRERPGRAAGQPDQHQGHAPDAEPAPRRCGPAAAHRGRLRGARAARRGPVRGDDQPDRGRATREYLVIEYAPSKRGQPPDRLYVPTDQLDEVTKYSGGEAPTLHRLGGADWAKAKGRARKAVRQIAAELIRLYSARIASPGHAFGPDTPWQRELEDAFPYVETGDQLAAIDEVKSDMERPIPMDRLICGDVGYGKTEIAVRAAFKAVQDGLQVAVLVPTTLLVQQHFSTFSERYGPFPVKVRALSRFQSAAETTETLRGWPTARSTWSSAPTSCCRRRCGSSGWA